MYKNKVEERMALAEELGGTNNKCIDVIWTTFETAENAQKFYDTLEAEGCAFYRQGVQDGNRVAWYQV